MSKRSAWLRKGCCSLHKWSALLCLGSGSMDNGGSLLDIYSSMLFKRSSRLRGYC